MSASICWRPKIQGRESVNTAAPSRFMETLKALTGQQMPMTLDHSHLSGLRALAIASPGEGGYPQLVKAIEEHGEIELTAEY
jgi:hypothetical protein